MPSEAARATVLRDSKCNARVVGDPALASATGQFGIFYSIYCSWRKRQAAQFRNFGKREMQSSDLPTRLMQVLVNIYHMSGVAASLSIDLLQPLRSPIAETWR